ncbi:MAG: choice-of-anchor D domain-containing protein [Alphaproteobacteria bacterium]|nr:choice-of-anchor D domain-containing protein [Alphaproteobacteria bacterium]
MRVTALLLTVFAAVGCSEYVIEETKNDNDEITDDDVPDIAVNPLEIDFGPLAVGDGASLSEVVTITNEGEGDLHIQAITLEDPETPFEVGAIGSVLVPPGQATTFVVTFSPETAASNSGTVLVQSDDPDESVVEVLLLGDGIAPIINVSPAEFDFGTLYIGCDNQQVLTISNIGNDTLIVDGFDFNTGSTDFLFDDMFDVNGELPWTLEPGEYTEVWVDYEPLDEYQDIAYTSVFSNDPATPTAMAIQTGNGVLFGENTDVFEQPINGATDILFAVDWSCSMSDDLVNVENNFTSFVTTLAGMDADYHVAVVTADNGCFNGQENYIDSSMSEADQQSHFSTMLHGSYGANTERAFMLLEAALSSSNIGSGGCNEGFYREDATLALTGVTDEPEQSVNPYSYYVSLFQSMKSNPDDVIIHAIAGDYPTGCGSASAGTGLYEATVATGGLFLSICATDFGAHLEALAEGSAADLTSFELSDIPVPQTIVVVVDGIQVNTGWEYNEVDNAVVFETDYVPEGGSVIEIDYAMMGDCEQ